jgi:hypothetical protein
VSIELALRVNVFHIFFSAAPQATSLQHAILCKVLFLPSLICRLLCKGIKVFVCPTWGRTTRRSILDRRYRKKNVRLCEITMHENGQQSRMLRYALFIPHSS